MSYSSSLITDSLTRQRMPTLPALQSPSALAGLSSPSGGSIAHDHGWGGLGLVIASVCDTDEQTTALCFTKCPLWAASSREHPFFSHAARGDPTLVHTHSTIKHRQIVHVNTHTDAVMRTIPQAKEQTFLCPDCPVRLFCFSARLRLRPAVSQSAERPQLCVFRKKRPQLIDLCWEKTLAFIWWDDGCTAVGCCCCSIKTSLTL